MVSRLDSDPERLISTLKSLQTPNGLKSTVKGKRIIEEMTGKKSVGDHNMALLGNNIRNQHISRLSD